MVFSSGDKMRFADNGAFITRRQQDMEAVGTEEPVNQEYPPKDEDLEEDVSDVADLDAEDEDYLFGTEHELIDPVTDEDLDAFLFPSQADEEFLFGTGVNEKPKTKYAISSRKRGNKRRREVWPILPSMGETR